VWFHTIAGDLDQAITIGTRRAEVFGGLGDRWARSSMQQLLGIATRLKGQHRQAARLFEESLTVGRELGLSYTTHRAMLELAIIAVLEGDLERADRLGQEALAVAQDVGYRVGMAMTQTAMGMAAHCRGDLLAARALHRQALEVFPELGVRALTATALSALPQLHARDLASGPLGGHRQQRLPAVGGSGHPRRQVDRGPEPVTLALHGRTGVHAHPHQGEAVSGAHVLHDAQAEPDRRGRVASPEHQRIPDALTSWA
jgi:tetratricopeptide (TPR) repeat protein